ncbi:MAG: tRNA pseudouridine(38-40) synthase TruA [bacterium]|nr:tRNA pseudouridine(38-40) synthase TruA [bacterium]MBK7670939.1 tRNA pseudouridine(38-40) synthase TruA [bacterium]
MAQDFWQECQDAVVRRDADREDFRLRVDLAYVGRDFQGWQIQAEARTVQGELRNLVSRVLDRPVMPVGAGRTDTGVHARGQVAHIALRSEAECDRLIRALPGMVPGDIAITGIRRVSPAFNARVSATSRRYSYHLLLGRDIFQPFCWQLGRGLDRDAVDLAASQFLGVHDFTSFCKASSLKDDGNTCDVSLCAFAWQGEMAVFHVRANRFLHHMVRNLVGLLVEIGYGRYDPRDIPRILGARSRSAAGGMAPPQGLFLEEVTYPEQLMDPDWAPLSPSGGDDA